MAVFLKYRRIAELTNIQLRVICDVQWLKISNLTRPASERAHMLAWVCVMNRVCVRLQTMRKFEVMFSNKLQEPSSITSTVGFSISSWINSPLPCLVLCSPGFEYCIGHNLRDFVVFIVNFNSPHTRFHHYIYISWISSRMLIYLLGHVLIIASLAIP